MIKKSMFVCGVLFLGSSAVAVESRWKVEIDECFVWNKGLKLYSHPRLTQIANKKGISVRKKVYSVMEKYFEKYKTAEVVVYGLDAATNEKAEQVQVYLIEKSGRELTETVNVSENDDYGTAAFCATKQDYQAVKKEGAAETKRVADLEKTKQKMNQKYGTEENPVTGIMINHKTRDTTLQTEQGTIKLPGKPLPAAKPSKK